MVASMLTLFEKTGKFQLTSIEKRPSLVFFTNFKSFIPENWFNQIVITSVFESVLLSNFIIRLII